MEKTTFGWSFFVVVSCQFLEVCFVEVLFGFLTFFVAFATNKKKK